MIGGRHLCPKLVTNSTVRSSHLCSSKAMLGALWGTGPIAQQDQHLARFRRFCVLPIQCLATAETCFRSKDQLHISHGMSRSPMCVTGWSISKKSIFDPLLSYSTMRFIESVQNLMDCVELWWHYMVLARASGWYRIDWRWALYCKMAMFVAVGKSSGVFSNKYSASILHFFYCIVLHSSIYTTPLVGWTV